MASVFLGNDQAHETLFLEVAPNFRGQVTQVIHLRAVGHMTEGLDLMG